MVPHLVLVGARPEVVGKILGLPIALTLVSRTGTDETFERKIAMHAVSTDITDPVQLLDCVRRIHEWRPVDAMIGGTEHALLPTAIVGDALGIRVNPVDAVRCAQDKAAMRRRLADKRVETIGFRICENVGEVREFFAGHPQGILLKPADGNGGRGIFAIREASDIPAAWEHVSREASSYGVLAEEYLTGIEASVETMSVAGEHRVLGLTYKHTSGPPHRVEVAHEMPGGHPPAFEKTAVDAVLAALTAIGYQWGPAHTEYFVSGDRATIVEINPRWAGDRIWELIELATGVDVARASAMAYCYDELPVPRTRDDRVYGVRFLTPLPGPGRIVSVTGADDAAALDGVIRIGEMSRIADVVPPLADWRGRTGYVTAAGPDRQTVHDIALEAAGRIRMQTVPAGPGSGMEDLGEDVRRAIRELIPSVQAELESLTRRPPVSAAPSRAADVRQAAEETARLLRAAGAVPARVADDLEGTPPAVIARYPGPQEMPTALLHGHYGKAGIAAHLVALRFFDGRPPVNVTVVIEGEDETGSPGAGAFLDRQRGELDAKAIMIGADTDPETGAGGHDESSGPGEFENACVEEVLGLIELARQNDKAQPPRAI